MNKESSRRNAAVSARLQMLAASHMKNKRLLKHSFTCITVLIPPPEQTGELAKVCLTSGVPYFSQRVHVGIWYILRAQRGSHIPTLRPKYILLTYMDPLGLAWYSMCLPYVIKTLRRGAVVAAVDPCSGTK